MHLIQIQRHAFFKLGLYGALAVLLVLPQWTTANVAPGTTIRESQLRVITDPPGARVHLNDRLQDVSPVTITNLPPGRHLISATLAGHHQARSSVIIQSGERQLLDIELKPITGLVLIHSTPPDADISINGAHRGRTPLLLTDLTIGRHRAAASRPGYIPMEVDIVIEDRTPQKIAMELRSDSANLRFDSEPQGAMVYIDGVLRGTTPCLVERVSSGESEIEIRHEGHQSFRQRLQLRAGEEIAIREQLTPLPGSMHLTSTPPGARIEINGELRGETPLQIEGLVPGRYTVRAVTRGYAEAVTELAVRHAGVVRHEFRLQPNSGAIELTTEPARVRVLIDGVDSGITEPDESDMLSKALSIELVEQGTRVLQLSRTGYYSREIRVQVEAGQTVTRHAQLRRRFIPDTRVRIGDGPGDVRTGIITQRHPDGSIELETRPGIFQTIERERIRSIDPIRTE